MFRSVRTGLILVSALFIWGEAFAQQLNPQVVWAMPKSVRIKCVTEQPGLMTVEYGLTESLGMTSTPAMRDYPNETVTRHYVILKNLQPNTTYYYRVRVSLQSGGELTSDLRTFRTYRPFTHVTPTVRYASYLIGAYYSPDDTNAPYHDWNAQHYDLFIAYENAAAIRPHAPDAILTLYDNVSNAYANLTNSQESMWREWAETNGIDPERIALHYAVDTKVNLGVDAVGDRKFDSIYAYVPGRYQEFVRFAWISYQFPNIVNGYVAVGHFQRFDIVYINLAQPASAGYDGVWEYCNGVDSQGVPTSWAPLHVIEDTTVVDGQKLATSGYVRFVPPRRGIWLPSRQPGEGMNPTHHQRVYAVRFRITSVGSSAPRTVQNDTCFQNEDFVKNSDDGKQIIPGWDATWETNPNNMGDPEYNPNPPSTGGPGVARSARFKWWSRLWYYVPRLLRYMTNVWDPAFRQWWVESRIPLLMQGSPYDGWYCDNYTVTNPSAPLIPNQTITVERGIYSASEHAVAYADLVEAISIKLTEMGKVSSANNFFDLTEFDRWSTPNSNPDRFWMHFAVGISNREDSDLWSFSFRPSNYSSLNTLIAKMAYHRDRGAYFISISNNNYAGRSDLATDTLSWWNRVEMRALAVYLLFKDPEDEYIWFNIWRNYYYGEFLESWAGQPRTPKQKWYYVDAAVRDLGQPVTTVDPPYQQWVAYPGSWYPGVVPGLFMLFETNTANVYSTPEPYDSPDTGTVVGNNGKVWYLARRYTKALVVYRDSDSNTRADSTTAVTLDQPYYILRSDNTLSSYPVNVLNLKNKEGAVLIPASLVDNPPAPQNPDVQITVSADKVNPKPLDVVTVTITAQNRGNSEARNVRIQFSVPSSATYVQGSLKVNGAGVPDPVDRTKIDLTIPSITAGASVIVQFQMVIR